MSYDVIRIYKNYSDEITRIDELHLSPILKAGTATSGPVLVSPKRSLSSTFVHSSSVDSNRAVGSIEVNGSFTDIDTSTGNYEWVTWDTFDGDGVATKIYMQMSDLPKIGDIV